MASIIRFVWGDKNGLRHVDPRWQSTKSNPDDALHELQQTLDMQDAYLVRVSKIWDYCPLCDTVSPPRLSEGSCEFCCGYSDELS